MTFKFPSLLKPTIKAIINENIGTDVCISGWVKKIRKHKNFWFADLNDGSSCNSIQTIIPFELLGDANELSLGSSAEITGKLNKSIGNSQNKEVLAEKVRILGKCPSEVYPIQKISNSLDFLRTSAINFKLRTSQDSFIARLKDDLALSLSQILKNNEFIRMFPPILTEHDCEAGGEVFRVTANRDNFFDKQAYLTVSTQLHLELAAASMARVYSFSPVFRAENHQTTRHLSEFWMLECEVSFIDKLDILLDLIEYFLKTGLSSILESNSYSILQHCSKNQDFVTKPFHRITYTDAITELSKFQNFKYPVIWGEDLKTEHERFLAEQMFCGPVFVTNYPSRVKPFYMKSNDDGITVACCDLIVPGIGEIVGGSLREDNYEKLNTLINSTFLGVTNENPLQWYLDLRKFGSVPHGGFGLGFDRFLQYISSTKNIRDTVMIPRFSGSIKY